MTEYIENEDIENEDNEGIEIKVPFDPNLVKVTSQPLTLGDIIDRIEHDEIKLDTEFQRRPDLWSLVKQSQLIESVLMRLPLPTFYFDGADDNKWRVIDGLQRISTLRNYVVEKKYSLQGLEFLTKFNGSFFDDLPRELQRRIKTFPITVYIVEKGTPEELKYNIFSRINRGGLILTPQEIRNALHQGIAADFVNKLAFDNSFKKATENKISSLRMEDRDFVARFIAFYLIGYEKYQPDLDSFISKGMSRIKTLSESQLNITEQKFTTAMETSLKIFGNDAFRKRFNATEKRRPINKALFEVFSVSLAKLENLEIEKILARKEEFRNRFIALMNNADGKFLRSITQGTALKDNVETRFKEINKIISEIIV